MALRVLRFCFVGLITVAINGCDSATKNPGVSVHPVTGTVTLDGAPVAGATVVFQGDARGASGVTNAQGVYSLTTFNPGDGAPEGTYKVGIEKNEIVGQDSSYFDVESPNYGKEQPPEARGKTVSHVAQKYATPVSSGLTATVQPGKNEINFEVTSK